MAMLVGDGGTHALDLPSEGCFLTLRRMGRASSFCILQNMQVSHGATFPLAQQQVLKVQHQLGLHLQIKSPLSRLRPFIGSFNHGQAYQGVQHHDQDRDQVVECGRISQLLLLSLTIIDFEHSFI